MFAMLMEIEKHINERERSDNLALLEYFRERFRREFEGEHRALELEKLHSAIRSIMLILSGLQNTCNAKECLFIC